MNATASQNLILIGMPGSGKSTVGRRLAKHFSLQFIDGDALIERAARMSIQNVVRLWGLKRFAELEQDVLCALNPQNAVISTGGSAVYSDLAMRHLGQIGQRIYLKISVQSMLRRVNDSESRGLFKSPAHSLTHLYMRRYSMYPKYADLTFDNNEPLTAVRADGLFRLIDQASNYGVSASPFPISA